MGKRPDLLQILQEQIIQCNRCPRLREHCQKIAVEKRRAYRDWEYWGKPVPAFGDPEARILILGLAPGAHGSNRTGRMFTGDGSGQTLYGVVRRTGCPSQPTYPASGGGRGPSDALVMGVARIAAQRRKPAAQQAARRDDRRG